MNIRAEAATVVFKVLTQKKSLDETLKTHLVNLKDKRDKSLLKELTFGTLRWHLKLDALTRSLLKKSKNTDKQIYSLILVGIYQLMYSRIPHHAAIFETVAATTNLKKTKAKSLVNAILRNFIRQKDALLNNIKKDPIAKYSHPGWLIKILKESWPNGWKSILLANNERPPLHLRVNLQKNLRNNYIKQLDLSNIKANPQKKSNTAVTLESPIDVSLIPNFYQGATSIQDLSAQYSAKLLELKPNLRVLDACAAPGNKTTHILETESALQELVAIDSVEKRLEMIKDNLKRLDLKATLICSDATKVNGWWNGKKFDRILLDAPCSGTGVIRRHPDIKILRQPKDIDSNTELQFKLLESLWPLLKQNGILLYATCSVLPQENQMIIAKFLSKYDNAKELTIVSDWGEKTKHGKQIFPEINGGDGFYYAKILKK